MELSSERVVATLEMSQIKSNDDAPFNVDGDYESLPPHASVMTHMTAGAVAGILEHTVMYPVDSVKVTYAEALGCGPHLFCPRSSDELRSTANCADRLLSVANEG